MMQISAGQVWPSYVVDYGVVRMALGLLCPQCSQYVIHCASSPELEFMHPIHPQQFSPQTVAFVDWACWASNMTSSSVRRAFRSCATGGAERYDSMSVREC